MTTRQKFILSASVTRRLLREFAPHLSDKPEVIENMLGFEEYCEGQK